MCEWRVLYFIQDLLSSERVTAHRRTSLWHWNLSSLDQSRTKKTWVHHRIESGVTCQLNVIACEFACGDNFLKRWQWSTILEKSFIFSVFFNKRASSKWTTKVPLKRSVVYGFRSKCRRNRVASTISSLHQTSTNVLASSRPSSPFSQHIKRWLFPERFLACDTDRRPAKHWKPTLGHIVRINTTISRPRAPV